MARLLYRLGGPVYDAVHWILTLGWEENLKHQWIRRLADCPHETVCDWGVGSGLSAIHILRLLPNLRHLHLVDSEVNMLGQARARIESLATQKGVLLTWHEGDGLALRLQPACDVMVCSYSLGMLPDDQHASAMTMARSNLKSDGHLLVLDMYPHQELDRLINQIYLVISRFVAARVYDVNFSGTLVEVVQQAFTQTDLVYYGMRESFAFLGRNESVGVDQSGLRPTSSP